MRVAIVNDLRLAVEALRRAVALLPGAEVAWIAENGEEAVARCLVDPPDVLLMDMVMPVMDGVEATRQIMRRSPCPILVVTATVSGNASKVYDALGAGALDAVATPRLGADGAVLDAGPLLRKIRTVALLAQARTAGPPPRPAAARGRAGRLPPLVAIGASTGGPQALATILKALPQPLPWPVLIVQHVDPAFAPGLAQWLSIESGVPVDPIRDGARVTAGRAQLAVSADHLVFDIAGCLRYDSAPAEAVHRPSVDVFFHAAAAAAPPGVAALLTGMGRDGADGLGRLRELRWHTIAQDRETSVVWGMPKAAAESGAAVETLPIDAIGPAITRAMHLATSAACRGASGP